MTRARASWWDRFKAWLKRATNNVFTKWGMRAWAIGLFGGGFATRWYFFG